MTGADTKDGHASVIVNPCTHNAVAAYRSTGGNVVLAFVSPIGGMSKFNIDTGTVNNGNDTCEDGSTCTSGEICRCNQAALDCGSTGGNCGRHFERVQLAAKYDALSAKCYIYAGYDVTTTSPKRYEARLKVVDVTSEAAPQVVRTMTAGRQSWYGTPMASRFSDAYGFTFYYDFQGDGTHCATWYEGWVTTSPTFASSTSVVLGGSFPNIWTGDYTGSVKAGLPGGYLFPTWMQPIEIPSGCSACNGKHYKFRTIGSRITP